MRLSSETIIEITGRKQRTALAHTDQATTRGDLRWLETPVYEVVMRLPNVINGANAQADAHTDGRERLVKMILGRFRAAAMKKRRPARRG